MSDEEKGKEKEAAQSRDGENMLTIGVVGFGNFGQFLGERYAKCGHRVVGTSRKDYTKAAEAIGCEFVATNDDLMDVNPDVIVLCTSIMSLHTVLEHFPIDRLKGKVVVDVLSVKLYPRELLLRMLPEEADILCTHPMFGPVSGAGSWEELPFMYDRVRVSEATRSACDAYISIYENEACRMVSMTCEEHDTQAASSQFLTHMTGRILGDLHVHKTLINTAGFESLLGVMDTTTRDSFDLFYGIYKYNPIARSELHKLETSLRHIREQLEDAEKEEDCKSTGGVSEVAPENAREAVLKGLAESYGEKESPNSHHDLMVSALGMCFVRRLAEKTKPKDAMGQPMPMDAGF